VRIFDQKKEISGQTGGVPDKTFKFISPIIES